MRKGLALSISFRIFTYNKEIKVMKNETKQQTAVEFLAEQFDNIVELYPSQFEKINNAIEQAKAMEKEQIVSAFNHGEDFSDWYFDVNNPSVLCSENYYNEIFNK